jgi:hypothetical protein
MGCLFVSAVQICARLHAAAARQPRTRHPTEVARWQSHRQRLSLVAHCSNTQDDGEDDKAPKAKLQDKEEGDEKDEL